MTTAGVALASAAAFGAAYMALTGLLILWASHLWQGGTATGVNWAFGMLAVGQPLGAIAAGTIAEHKGLGTAFGIAAALSTAGLLLRPGRGQDPPARKRPMTAQADQVVRDSTG